ncbi:MAG: rRNA maturation RNase YbeY, partial [Candidatus Cloacimonetes bacterium 4572_65]
MLNIDNQSKYRVINSLFERIQKIVFTEEKADLDRYIDLLFVDNYESRSYNKRFRGKDSETDVISFPAELEFLPTYGDIIIDISVADRQKDNRTLEEELTTLFLHGVLHL